MPTKNSVCSCGCAADTKALNASIKKLTSDNAKLTKKLATAEAKASKAASAAKAKLQKANDQIAKLKADNATLKAAAKAAKKTK